MFVGMRAYVCACMRAFVPLSVPLLLCLPGRRLEVPEDLCNIDIEYKSISTGFI